MDIFPEAIKRLPLADIPLDGVSGHLAQGSDHQILFMSFDQDVVLSEHTHGAQYGIVLEGRIDLCINGIHCTYYKGDRYYIPAGVKHHGKIYAGYSDITFFEENDRYNKKNK